MFRQRATPTPKPKPNYGTYGLMAEFGSAEDILEAAHKAYAAGYRKMEAYTPIPVHGLDAAIGYPGTRLPYLIFAGGLTGAAGMFLFQTWVNVMDYPLNIGGRPYFSWPSFIPVTFEGMVLFASFAAVIGLIAFCGLPMPYHPVFNTPRFERASSDLFFLSIEASDPLYDRVQTQKFLESLHPQAVSEVEN